jgi:hypothetical protein
MTPDQRDHLLDLHRAAMRAQSHYVAGDCPAAVADRADDAFRDYLFSLPVT